jgi:hypothetical protein
MNMVAELIEGEEELVVDLDDDDIMEGENSRIKPSRIMKMVKDDKVA